MMLTPPYVKPSECPEKGWNPKQGERNRDIHNVDFPHEPVRVVPVDVVLGITGYNCFNPSYAGEIYQSWQKEVKTYQDSEGKPKMHDHQLNDFRWFVHSVSACGEHTYIQAGANGVAYGYPTNCVLAWQLSLEYANQKVACDPPLDIGTTLDTNASNHAATFTVRDLGDPKDALHLLGVESNILEKCTDILDLLKLDSIMYPTLRDRWGHLILIGTRVEDVKAREESCFKAGRGGEPSGRYNGTAESPPMTYAFRLDSMIRPGSRADRESWAIRAHTLSMPFVAASPELKTMVVEKMATVSSGRGACKVQQA